jgi:hypothetical protein
MTIEIDIFWLVLFGALFLAHIISSTVLALLRWRLVRLELRLLTALGNTERGKS